MVRLHGSPVRLLLAGNAISGPWQHLQTPRRNFLFALQTDPERSRFESLKRRSDLTQLSRSRVERTDQQLAVHVQLQMVEGIGGILDPEVFPIVDPGQ